MPTPPRSIADLLTLASAGLSTTHPRRSLRRGLVPVAALLGGAGALAGCGGGSGTTGSGALIRAVDASTNGGSATVYVNGTNYTGSQNFFSNTFYLNLPTGNDSFTFTLGARSGATYPGVTSSASSGSYYSAIVLGRSDVTTNTDPRFPRMIVVNDSPTAPPVGQTRVRVIQAAPDAPNVDVLIDGQVAVSDVAYTAVGSYLDLAGGNHTIQINQTGTSTVLMAPQTVAPAAGLVYSLYVLEGAVTPTPTYIVELIGDAR